MITITFNASDEQRVSGIPRTVEISTSQAATVYYTLDGTLPTPFSSVYVGPITMPTDVSVVVLSAIAYYLDDDLNLVPSPVLSETFATDHTSFDRYRLLFFEGVVYIFPGGADIPYYYDGDGELTTTIDFPEEELDLLIEDRDYQGRAITPTNAVAILPPEETADLLDGTPPDVSSPNQVATFNSEARMIIIDGRTGAIPAQVELVNGPFMSLRNSRGNFGGIDFFNTVGTNYVSGSGTRMVVDRARGLVVFYYFDTNTARWVKSIQELESAPAADGAPAFGPSRTIPWMVWGRQQTLP